MNKVTARKITNAAPFLITHEAKKYREYLASPLRMAVDIIEVFDGKNWDKSREIARLLIEKHFLYQEKGLNSGTVCQVLQALRDGSIALESNCRKGWYLHFN